MKFKVNSFGGFHPVRKGTTEKEQQARRNRMVNINKSRLNDFTKKLAGFEEMVDTNMGLMPVEDYLDISAQSYGYDDYADLRKTGYRIDVSSDIIKVPVYA